MTADSAILFVLSTLQVGGSESKTVRLANTLADILAARSRRVVIAYLNAPQTLLRSVSPAVETVHLGRRGKFSPGALIRLIRVVRSRNVRVVVSVNLYPSLYVFLATLFCRKASCRTVAWVNTTHFNTAREEGQMRLYRRILRRTHTILFGAEAQRKLWCQRYGLFRPGEYHAVLYNGVDTQRFDRERVQPVGTGQRPATQFLLGNVARLNPEKAQVDLVRAVSQLRSEGFDVGAVIVGDGPSRGRIENAMQTAGVEPFVRIVGEVSDVRPWLAALDVFVLTSVNVETFSNAVLEAMSMGCPIVSSTVGGMEEMLRFGGGLTYPPGDITLLCDRLRALLRSAARRRQLAREARHAALTHFAWERMVTDFLAHLDYSSTASSDAATAETSARSTGARNSRPSPRGAGASAAR